MRNWKNYHIYLVNAHDTKSMAMTSFHSYTKAVAYIRHNLKRYEGCFYIVPDFLTGEDLYDWYNSYAHKFECKYNAK